MRVVIAKKLLSTVGGSEAQARALGAALRDRGHDVTLVGLRPAHRRPGIPQRVYDAPLVWMALFSDGLLLGVTSYSSRADALVAAAEARAQAD